MASTQAEDMLTRDRSEVPVSPAEPGYEAIAAIIEHAKQVCAELNAGYHTPERTHELFEELVGHPVDPTFRLNAPFRTDFGRNIEVGAQCVRQLGLPVHGSRRHQLRRQRHHRRGRRRHP